jgi:hypothetical protein
MTPIDCIECPAILGTPENPRIKFRRIRHSTNQLPAVFMCEGCWTGNKRQIAFNNQYTSFGWFTEEVYKASPKQ